MTPQPTVLRGHSPNDLIQQIAALEEEMGLSADRPPPNRCKPMLVGATSIYFTTPLESLTTFLPQRIVSALTLRTTDQFQDQLACSARWIHVKSNITAYFPEHDLIAKTRGPGSPADIDAIKREYNVLQELHAYDPAVAPTPVAFKKTPYPTVWMRAINGRRFRSNEKDEAATTLTEKLLGFYEDAGISWQSLNTLPEWTPPSRHDLETYGWNDEEATTILSALHEIGSWRVPVSTIHGDAIVSNTLREPSGNMRIIDWEHARTGPIFFDIASLASRFQGAYHVYAKWKRDVGDNARSPEMDQLARRVLKGLDLRDHQHRIYHVRYRASPDHHVRIHRDKTLKAAHRLLENAPK